MTAMLYDGYNAWDECPEADDCELIRSFLELVDAMVRDIQHLKAEAVRARYRFAMETDPERKQITTVDILSDLDMPHYDSLAYQEFSRICYDGGDPMAFKEFTNSMVHPFRKACTGLPEGMHLISEKCALCKRNIQL